MDSDDVPAVILPIAWQSNTQQHPVAYSSSPNTSVPAVSANPAYCPVFDNVVEKEWLKKSSAIAEGPCSNSNDRIQHVSLLILINDNSPCEIGEHTLWISVTMFFHYTCNGPCQHIKVHCVSLTSFMLQHAILTRLLFYLECY